MSGGSEKYGSSKENAKRIMGTIYILMGKSATGKDTIYQRLIEDASLGLKKMIGYTTRPIRNGEEDGREYHFVDMAGRKALRESGKIIEERVYHTVYGDWYYFTADDGQADADDSDCLLIATLEAYQNIRRYYGEERVVPLYIEVEDGERLLRAIEREKRSGSPKYAEMCRRFLADAADFSEEKLKEAGIEKRYENRTMEDCLSVLRQEIAERSRRNRESKPGKASARNPVGTVPRNGAGI